MKAIILAAGRGKRLGELGADLPKGLLPINGQCPLERYRHAFDRAGVVDEVIVVGGHRIDDVRERLPSGFRLIESDRYASTNSLYSLWLALESLGDEDVAVFNADVVYDPNLLGRFLRSPRRTAVLLDELRAFDEQEYHARVVDGLVRELSLRVPASESFGQDAQAFKVAREHVPLVRAYAREQLRSGGHDLYSGCVLSILGDAGLLHPVYTNQQAWSEFDTVEAYRECADLIAALEGQAPEYLSYGMDDEPQAAGLTRASPAVQDAGTRSWRHLARRAGQCVANWELPVRLRWVPVFFEGFGRSPWRALRWLRPLANSSLSLDGFRLQVHGHELLRAIMSESSVLGIRPFLLWGTLLGCVRDGAFIPNDHDVDMGLGDGDFHRVPELKRRLLARGFRVRLEHANKISFRHPRVPGLWVDIDRIVETRDHLWSGDPPSGEPVAFAYWFPRASLDRLTARTFEGVEVFVPGGAEDILTAIYGTWHIRQQKRDYLRGPLNLMLWQQAVRS